MDTGIEGMSDRPARQYGYWKKYAYTLMCQLKELKAKSDVEGGKLRAVEARLVLLKNALESAHRCISDTLTIYASDNYLPRQVQDASDRIAQQGGTISYCVESARKCVNASLVCCIPEVSADGKHERRRCEMITCRGRRPPFDCGGFETWVPIGHTGVVVCNECLGR